MALNVSVVIGQGTSAHSQTPKVVKPAPDWQMYKDYVISSLLNVCSFVKAGLSFGEERSFLQCEVVVLVCKARKLSRWWPEANW